MTEEHFVEFYSPGTFVCEQSSRPIKSWHIPSAKRMARRIKERYGATPHSFRFVTVGKKVTKRSNLYWLGGRIETREQIEARNDPKEEILRFNLKANDIDRVIINDNSYRFTSPLGKNDVVLEWVS